MYGYFAKEIKSHRDLPLRLNQWNNVVRWEFKHPMPFLRSREFHWQEGHTAHLTEEEAKNEVLLILDHYADVYEQLLAVPVVKGFKTKSEQFPGADYTTTIEGFIPATGRGIQAATSHCLGQHFSKMFGITVEDPASKELGKKMPPIHVWQTSWGLTTRSIGIMVLTHGDDKGLILPPRIAKIQAIIIPAGITAKTSARDKEAVYEKIREMLATLQSAGVRTKADLRDEYTPGWKFSDWELKGVPLRLEFGPRDLSAGTVTLSRRNYGDKRHVAIVNLTDQVSSILDDIQTSLFRTADEAYRSCRKKITHWQDFVPALNARNVCLVPHCLSGDCEDQIKKMSARHQDQDGDTGVTMDTKAPSMGAKSLCIPFEQPSEIVPGEMECINLQCKRKAEKWVMFGRSY